MCRPRRGPLLARARGAAGTSRPRRAPPPSFLGGRPRAARRGKLPRRCSGGGAGAPPAAGGRLLALVPVRSGGLSLVRGNSRLLSPAAAAAPLAGGEEGKGGSSRSPGLRRGRKGARFTCAAVGSHRCFLLIGEIAASYCGLMDLDRLPLSCRGGFVCSASPSSGAPAAWGLDVTTRRTPAPHPHPKTSTSFPPPAPCFFLWKTKQAV